MTIVVQFESSNWYAEGVAVMHDSLFNHPIMEDALDRIAKDQGFDFVSCFERELSYAEIHDRVDQSC